jgi:tetratricopeptide (TPR) repeat protein
VRRRRSALGALGALAGSLALGLALATAPRAASAQEGDPFARAEALEQQEQWFAAAAAYRAVLAVDPVSLGALLGLERAYDQLGTRDSILVPLARAIAVQPRNAALRGMQLRALHATRDRAVLRAAFDDWRRAAPGDPAPYRAYARLLLADGDTRAADTVLRDAGAGNDARGFAYETAMLRASLGAWESAAELWRVAVTDLPYLERSAVSSLAPTPGSRRDAVRAALAAPPPAVAPRMVLASLELVWGEPRAGWNALRELPADSAGRAAWLEFAGRAEGDDAWLIARDALMAVAGPRGDAPLLARAARDALRGGDALGAEALAARAAAAMDSTTAGELAVPVLVEALSILGRPTEAERLAAAYRPCMERDQREAIARRVAWAWVRAGDLPRARASLEGSGTDAGEAGGWFALYDGDLAAARRALPPERARTADDLLAAAFLGRTTRDRSAAAGRAFLALARGDSTKAAREFGEAAAELPDAAPLLLALAARIDAARGDDGAAIALWQRVVEEMPASPEAPASDLEWARALRRSHHDAEAVTRLEHLILTYPDSALLPQARRELESARRAIPTSS